MKHNSKTKPTRKVYFQEDMMGFDDVVRIPPSKDQVDKLNLLLDQAFKK